MIKIKESELDSCKKEIQVQQKLIMLYDALMLSKEFKNEFQYGLSHNLVNQLLDEILEKHLKLARDFCIDLKSEIFSSYALNFCKNNKKDLETYKLQMMATNLVNTQRYLYNFLKVKEIDLIEVMIKTGNYDLLIKIILSISIKKEDIKNVFSRVFKKDIIRRVIKLGKDKINDIFDTIPEGYSNADKEIEKLRKKIDKKLSIVSENRVYCGCGCLSDEVRKIIKSNDSDCEAKQKDYLFVRFLIEHNLININNIEEMYYGNYASSACVSLLSSNDVLGYYLYNLPSYKEMYPNTRNHSDKCLLSYFVNGSDIMNLISSVNFEATPEKLELLERLIINSQKENKDCYSYNNLDEIINIFLRKTKKEHYKDMKEAIVSIKANTDPRLQDEYKARERLVRTLQNICNPLLEQVSDKANVGDVIKTIKQKNS